jgi:hypothetical protein
VITSALRAPDATIVQAALRAAATHRARDFNAPLQDLARDTSRPAPLRVAALQTAAGGDKPIDDASFALLAEPFVAGGSPTARLQAAAAFATARLTAEQLRKLADLLPVAGPVELPQLVAAFRSWRRFARAPRVRRSAPRCTRD